MCVSHGIGSREGEGPTSFYESSVRRTMAREREEGERKSCGTQIGDSAGRERGRVIEKASFYPMEQEHCQKSQASGGRVEHKQREKFGAAWRAIGSAGVGMDSRYSGPKSHSYVCLICSEGKHGEPERAHNPQWVGRYRANREQNRWSNNEAGWPHKASADIVPPVVSSARFPRRN